MKNLAIPWCELVVETGVRSQASEPRKRREGPMEPLDLSLLEIGGGTQPRTEINEDLVAEYADLMTEGVAFPPVIVFFDGVTYWLADGFHRYHAACRNGFLNIPADVSPGTRRDAILYSVGANTAHGQRRTNADKRRAVMTLIDDKKWSKWSDSEIARRCGVSHTFVANLRPSLGTVASEPPARRTYRDKHGTVTTMNVEKIGRQKGTTKPRQVASGEVVPFSHARVFKEMAISQLERIRKDDPERTAVLLEVQEWITKELEGGIACRTSK